MKDGVASAEQNDRPAEQGGNRNLMNVDRTQHRPLPQNAPTSIIPSVTGVANQKFSAPLTGHARSGSVTWGAVCAGDRAWRRGMRAGRPRSGFRRLPRAGARTELRHRPSELPAAPCRALFASACASPSCQQQRPSLPAAGVAAHRKRPGGRIHLAARRHAGQVVRATRARRCARTSPPTRCAWFAARRHQDATECSTPHPRTATVVPPKHRAPGPCLGSRVGSAS